MIRQWAIVGIGILVAQVSAASAQGVLLRSFDGEARSDSLGEVLSGSADINADGVKDTVIGEPSHDGPAGANSGRVSAYSGADGTLLLQLNGEAADDRFGLSLSGVSDLDGDTHDEIVVGAFRHAGPGGALGGRAYVFSGATGTPLHVWDGEESEDLFGWAVSDAGDVDDDGTSDVIVGAPEICPQLGCLTGKVYVFSGATGALLRFWAGADLNTDRLGYSVAGAGRVDADAHDDVIVGAIDILGGLGRAFVFSGATGADIHTFFGPFPTTTLGIAVAGPGDTDGDGSDDLFVLDRSEGEAILFSGATGAALHTFTNIDGMEAIAGVGDVDGDGRPDVAHSGNDTSAGASARIHSGVTGALLYSIEGLPLQGFGDAVAGTGDLDGDGVPEVLVGADPFDGPAGVNSGKAFVYALKGDCEDLDGDGWGEPLLPECGFTGGPDCDDFDENVNPGASEIPGNGVDDDCDGEIDEAPPGCAAVAVEASGTSPIGPSALGLYALAAGILVRTRLRRREA